MGRMFMERHIVHDVRVFESNKSPLTEVKMRKVEQGSECQP